MGNAEKKPTVLIVDDDPQMCVLMTELLKGAGEDIFRALPDFYGAGGGRTGGRSGLVSAR